MPAPLAPSRSTSTSPTKVHSNPHSQNGKSQTKTRVARPRRRRAVNGIESDEEIEREARSDLSDSDSQRSSFAGSDSESEGEDESLAKPNGTVVPAAPRLANALNRSASAASADTADTPLNEVPAPSTPPLTPPRPAVAPPKPTASNGRQSSKAKKKGKGQAPKFEAVPNWSELVASEEAASETLPVIDFADMGGDSGITKPSTSSESAAIDTSADAGPSSVQRTGDSSIATESRSKTAREAYKRRLESDPSYVPRVGEFWGHDERLLDKDLRSLSGWWRGRWRGRGAGPGSRGFAWAPRGGRGRGGFGGFQRGFRGPPESSADNDHATASEDPSAEAGPSAPTPPPIERKWTHDGYEEMNQKRYAPRPDLPFHPNNFRGRGGFRGARGGRGGGPVTGSPRPTEPSASPSRSSAETHRSGPSQPVPQPSIRGKPNYGRPWKERPWTKEHEAHLYFNTDPALKPTPSQGPGVIVKLPSKAATVVRLPKRRFHAKPQPPSQSPGQTAETTVDRPLIVKLPSAKGKERETPPHVPVSEKENIITVGEVPLDDPLPLQVRTQASTPLVPVAPVPSRSKPVAKASDNPRSKLPPALAPVVSSAIPLQASSPDSIVPQQVSSAYTAPAIPAPVSQEAIQRQIEEVSNARQKAAEEEAKVAEELRKVTEEEAAILQGTTSTSHPSNAEVPQQPPHIPLPQPQLVHPSPAYGTPYMYPAHAVPPGIAMAEDGQYYEIATGRVVYLGTPPPMAPMYAPVPRPFMHGHSMSYFTPHAHHPMSTPDFAHIPPHRVPIDPETGAPLFSLPRQSRRIEIRDPSSSSDKDESFARSKPAPSGLRTSVTADQQPFVLPPPAPLPGYATPDHGYYGPPTTHLFRPPPPPTQAEASGSPASPGDEGQAVGYYPPMYMYPPPPTHGYEAYSAEQAPIYY